MSIARTKLDYFVIDIIKAIANEKIAHKANVNLTISPCYDRDAYELVMHFPDFPVRTFITWGDVVELQRSGYCEKPLEILDRLTQDLCLAIKQKQWDDFIENGPKK